MVKAGTLLHVDDHSAPALFPPGSHAAPPHPTRRSNVIDPRVFPGIQQLGAIADQARALIKFMSEAEQATRSAESTQRQADELEKNSQARIETANTAAT